MALTAKARCSKKGTCDAIAESSLSLSYKDYADRVGAFLGWGPGNWSAVTPWGTPYQTSLVDDCVRSGVRKFYYTTPPYDWSFMHPFITLPLPQGASSVQLPDDVGGVEGEITLTYGTSCSPYAVDFINGGKIKLLQAQFPGSTGRPTSAALDYIKGTTALSGQRMNLLVFPEADQGYTLEFRAYVTPDAPTVSSPFVYGGPQHVETILEACLSVAEQRMDDKVAIHTQLFAERLQASMAIDGRTKPQVFGYNFDNSDDKRNRRNSPNHWFPVLGTYNGTSLG